MGGPAPAGVHRPIEKRPGGA